MKKKTLVNVIEFDNVNGKIEVENTFKECTEHKTYEEAQQEYAIFQRKDNIVMVLQINENYDVEVVQRPEQEENSYNELFLSNV